MSKRVRQYVGILTAVIAYYLIHEGAHLITALCCGAFRQVNILSLGIQIDIYPERMTELQLGLFCLAGPAATLAAGLLLILSAKRICCAKFKLFKTIMWYVTLTVLLLDPVYLSILCGFFGGGDMNGIRLLLPEGIARGTFALIGAVNVYVIRKHLLAEYTNAFAEPRR